MNLLALLPLIIKLVSAAASLIPIIKADASKIEAAPDLQAKVREALHDLEEIAATLEDVLA